MSDLDDKLQRTIAQINLDNGEPEVIPDPRIRYRLCWFETAELPPEEDETVLGYWPDRLEGTRLYMVWRERNNYRICNFADRDLEIANPPPKYWARIDTSEFEEEETE